MPSKKLTPQEVYDTVAKHLLEQGYRCTDTDGVCMYRFGAAKSAIGALIHAKFYTQDLEGKPVTHKDVRRVLDKSNVPTNTPNNLALLRDLQALHDKVEPQEWRKYLDMIATTWGLDSIKARRKDAT